MTLLDLLVKAGAVLTTDFTVDPHGWTPDEKAQPVSCTVPIEVSNAYGGGRANAPFAHALLRPGKYRAVILLVPRDEIDR